MSSCNLCATEPARVEWERRVAMEYAVCGLAQDFARRLTQTGAPAQLIEQALRMALDELEHALLAQDVLEAAGSDELVTFDPGCYTIDRSDDPIIDMTLVAVSNLCLGETLAVRVSQGLRRNAMVPVAADALDRVVRDEPRHAALGWQTLDWLLQLPSRKVVRETIESHLEGWIQAYRDAFAGPEVISHLACLNEHDLAWGLATSDYHRTAFDRTLIGDWIPRLARRSFSITI